jgi:hypothetical protein
MALAVVGLRVAIAAAEGPPVHLLLPLLTTVALGGSFVEKHVGNDVAGPGAPHLGRRRVLSYLPSLLTVPDLYTVDVAEREPHRFAAPVDRTTYAAFTLLPSRLLGGPSLSIAYATESLPALRETGRLLRLKFEFEF